MGRAYSRLGHSTLVTLWSFRMTSALQRQKKKNTDKKQSHIFCYMLYDTQIRSALVV